jgi:hypothetical protein
VGLARELGPLPLGIMLDVAPPPQATLNTNASNAADVITATLRLGVFTSQSNRASVNNHTGQSG